MVEWPAKTPMEVSEAVQELDQLADRLGMPIAERSSILGLSSGAYRSWQDGDVGTAAVVAPELTRRLNYALPLMRRMAANLSVVPLGRSHNRPRPTAT